MPKNQVYKTIKAPGPFTELWKNFRRDIPSMFGFGSLMIMLSLALLGQFITPYEPTYISGPPLIAPSWEDAGTPKYLLGTDQLGRDLYTRLIYGLQIGLFSALTITLLSFVIGVSIGTFSALLPGYLKHTVLRVADLLISVPSLLVAILIIATIGPRLLHVYIALIIVYVPLFIKVTHEAIKSEETKDYVLAAKANGASTTRLFLKSLLPNIASPLIIQTTFSLANTMLDIAALGFLGLGAQAPTPEWGAMINQAKDLIFTSPWQILLPGLALGFSLFTIHMVGSGLRKALGVQIGS